MVQNIHIYTSSRDLKMFCCVGFLCWWQWWLVGFFFHFSLQTHSYNIFTLNIFGWIDHFKEKTWNYCRGSWSTIRPFPKNWNDVLGTWHFESLISVSNYLPYYSPAQVGRWRKRNYQETWNVHVRIYSVNHFHWDRALIQDSKTRKANDGKMMDFYCSLHSKDFPNTS